MKMKMHKGFAGALALSLILGGCSANEEVEEASAEEVEEARKFDFFIGQETDTYALYIENTSDKTLTSFEYKENDEEEYSENLFESAELNANQILLWYAGQPEDFEQDGKETAGYYDVKIEDAQENEYVLHQIQPDEMDLEKDIQLAYDEEENLFYLEYTDTEGEKVSTLEDEKEIAANEKEEQETKTEEAADQQEADEQSTQSADQSSSASASQSSSSNNTNTSSSSTGNTNTSQSAPSYSQSTTTTTTTTTTAPSTSTDTYTPDTSGDPSAGLTNTWDVPSTGDESSEGCLGGAN